LESDCPRLSSCDQPSRHVLRSASSGGQVRVTCDVVWKFQWNGLTRLHRSSRPLACALPPHHPVHDSNNAHDPVLTMRCFSTEADVSFGEEHARDSAGPVSERSHYSKIHDSLQCFFSASFSFQVSVLQFQSLHSCWFSGDQTYRSMSPSGTLKYQSGLGVRATSLCNRLD
jgi:hypothetical protein